MNSRSIGLLLRSAWSAEFGIVRLDDFIAEVGQGLARKTANVGIILAQQDALAVSGRQFRSFPLVGARFGGLA